MNKAVYQKHLSSLPLGAFNSDWSGRLAASQLHGKQVALFFFFLQAQGDTTAATCLPNKFYQTEIIRIAKFRICLGDATAANRMYSVPGGLN